MTDLPNRAGTVGLAALALAVTASDASAQTAREIFDASLARYQAQTADIAAYTLVQDVMGMPTETRFVRREIDGMRVFVPANMPEADGVPLTEFPAFAESATVLGVETLEDGACHLLSVDDVASLEGGFGPMPDEEMEFEARSATFCIDTDTYMVRRVSVEGMLTVAGETHPATMRVASDDYRDTDGLLVPFRTTVTLEGMDAAMGTDAAQMRAGMEAARAELERMPPEQRAAMEEMLEQQFAQMEGMLAGGAPSMTVTVTEVRVERN